MEKIKKTVLAGFALYLFACSSMLVSVSLAAGAEYSAGCIADSPWPMVQHDMFHTGQSISYGFAMREGVTKFSVPVASDGIASPVIDTDGTIYIGSTDGCIYSVSQNGAAECIYSVKPGTFESTPALSCNEILYAGAADGNLYAISTDGKLQWQIKLGETIQSSPVIGRDGMIFVGADKNESSDGSFFCISPDGKIIWEYATGAIGHVSPAIDQYGNVYIASAKGILYAFHSDGDLLWSYPAEDVITSSPVISSKNGGIYFTTAAALIALDYSGEVMWQPYAPKATLFGSEEDSAFVASPAVDQEGNIYIGGILGDLHCLNDKGEKQWSSMIKAPTFVDPVPAAIVSAPILDKAGNIYVLSQNALYSLKSQAGKVTGVFNANPESTISNSTIQASPSLGADRTFYISSADGNLYAVGSSEKMFSLSGSVKGDSIEGVQVYIRSTSEEPEEYEAEINDQGQYSARYLYQGKYLVYPFKEGLKFDPPSNAVRIRWLNINNINFTTKASGPAIVSAQAEPSRAANTSLTLVLLTAGVVHYAGQDHIASVTIDLSEIGGSATQEMKDDGTQGDTAAGDGIFSYTTAIPPSVSLGPKGLVVVAKDNAGMTVKRVIGLEVMSEITGIEPGEYQVIISDPGQKLTLKFSAAAAGFMLQVFKPQAASPVENCFTAAEQIIEFENAEVGTWVYKVINRQGCLSSTKNENASLKVLSSSSGQYKLATTTAGTGIVFGSVTEIETGNPVNNAAIVTTVGANAASQDGYYLLLGPAGVFTITASDATHMPASKSVNLMTGSSVQADILLQLKSSGGGGTGTCAFEAAFDSHEPGINLLRSFRDTALSRSSCGMEYITRYYRFAPEVTAMIEHDPSLKEMIRKTVVALLPAIQKWSGNEAFPLNALQTSSVRECLNKIKAGGSVSLQREIDRLILELENGKLLKSLGLY